MFCDTILQAKGSTVYSVPAEARIGDAVEMLNRHNIGAVVVLDAEGAVVGILSERDVVRHLGDDPARFFEHKVADYMTTEVITARRDTAISLLMEQMTEFRVRHLPVVEDGRLIGLVSIGDVVKRTIEQAEQDAEAMRQYIAAGTR